MNALSIVDSDNALGFVELDEEIDNYEHRNSEAKDDPEVNWVDGRLNQPKSESEPADVSKKSGAEASQGGWKLGNNADEDDGGNAVADSLFGNEFAKPHENNRASDHGGDGERPVGSGRSVGECGVGGDNGLVKA